MKKYLLLFAVSFFLLPFVSNAQSVEPKLVYPDNLAIDSDLDGLTDIGETTRFKTDPKNPDSDADGWYDGTEVLAAGNPLDNTAPSATTTISTNTTTREVPWVWYLTRASGLIAFAFAWIVIFLGVAIRLPILNKILKPAYSLSAHHSLAFQTLFFSLLHGGSFLFDPYLKPSFADVFIPFWTDKLDPLSLSLGILALYGFIILVLTSWMKPMIPHRVWRVTHFLNIFVYVAVITHALLLGTDLANPLYRNIFISANIFLMGLILLNFALKLVGAFQKQQPTTTSTTPTP
jgi:predicted ferric reductase